MAGYNSKFTGQQVDSLLEKAGSSYQKPETGIPQSDLAESTQQILQNVENKVSKEEGKGLSTNDFTDEYKAKVEDSASQEGYFPKMSVGIAANLAGRGEATEQVFTYRPTDGGTSIESGVAKIRRVKGNSIVWNQLMYPTKWTTDSVNGTVNMSDDYSEITHINAGNNSFAYIHASNINYPSREGHIMYFYAEVSKGYSFYACKTNARDEFTLSPIVKVTNNGLRTPLIAFYKNDGSNFEAGEEITIKNVVMFDLTAMFGAGNELATVEEFRALYPDSYYPYNAGELRDLVCSGIKTVGFNQWDEQWEVGNLGTDEYGSPITFDGMIRSTNYNPIFPSTEYYIRTSNAATYIWYYDSDKKYIGRDINPNSRFFITPTNAAYFKLRIGDTTNTITTYNHDICINLHHTGWRDGDYEPYKEVTHSLPLSQITNGEPLRKAGSVYDEINETEYIKRVGVVDLGSYDWYETPNGTFNTVVNIPDIKAVESEHNYTCKKYIGVSNPSTIYAGTADNLTISTNAAGRIYIRDDAYKTGTAYAAVPALKASLSGVLLHYELAEPIVKPIETPLNLDYQVEDFGTEEALLTDNSAPFSADIVYQFNAVDRIRENSLDIEDLLARVIALENAAATTTSIPDIPDITE